LSKMRSVFTEIERKALIVYCVVAPGDRRRLREEIS
jgi:hypothetical protein